MKDFFNKELQVGDYFIYHNASRNSKFSICKVIELFEDKVICKTLLHDWRNTYRLSEKLNTYSMSDRIIKCHENMLPQEYLNLFGE